MKRVLITTIIRNENDEITGNEKYLYDQRENVRTLESQLAFQRALAVLHGEVFPEAEEVNLNEIYYWLLHTDGDPRYMRVAINTTFIPVGNSPLLYDLLSEFEIEKEDEEVVIQGANFFLRLMRHLRGESEAKKSESILPMEENTSPTTQEVAK